MNSLMKILFLLLISEMVEGKSPLLPVDLNNDGLLDLVCSAPSGTLSYFENKGNSNLLMIFVEKAEIFHDIDVGFPAAPAFFDVDGDGDQDLFVGNSEGKIIPFENIGSATSPRFMKVEREQMTGLENMSMHSISRKWVGNHARPVFTDINNDGRMDLVVGRRWWKKDPKKSSLVYYGNLIGPFSEYGNTVLNPFKDMKDIPSASPTFVDLNGNKRNDLVVGTRDGILFFEHMGYHLTHPTIAGAQYPEFEERTGERNPFNKLDLEGGVVVPAFGDLDNDGDFDLMMAGDLGCSDSFEIYENTGDANNPEFIE